MPQVIGYPVKLNKRAAQKYVDAVREAKDKLSIGRDFRRMEREDKWIESERQYLGDHWDYASIEDDSADLITVNMSFSTINTIVPFMTGEDPRFIVRPYSGDASVTNATIQQALLNRLWRSEEVAAQRHLEAAAVDFLVYGDGFLKVGFTLDQVRQGLTEYAEIAKIWVDRIDPWDVWIDPSADGIHNARWVCQRLRLTRTEIEEDGRYFNLHDENMAYSESDLTTRDDSRPDDRQVVREVYDGSEYAVVYEFYDLIHKRMISFSEGELPIRWVDDISIPPIVQMSNYRIPRSPWHMGELEQLWDLQQELNKTRSQLITHRKRNVPKLVGRKGALDQTAIDALQSPTVMEVALVDGDQPLNELLTPINLPNLSAEAYNLNQMTFNDIYEISGVSEYLRGASPTIRRTATEASIIEGATNVKSTFKLRQAERAARDAGSLILGIAKDVFPQTAFDEMQLFITGREAELIQKSVMGDSIEQLMGQGIGQEELFGALGGQAMNIKSDAIVSPSPDIFVGKYEVEVEKHSTEIRNPQLREQKFREMTIDLVQMVPILGQMGVQVNMRKMLELWFEAAGIDDVEALFEPGGGMQQGMGMGMPQGMAQGMPNQPGMPPNAGLEGPPGAQPTPQDSGQLDASYI